MVYQKTSSEYIIIEYKENDVYQIVRKVRNSNYKWFTYKYTGTILLLKNRLLKMGSVGLFLLSLVINEDRKRKLNSILNNLIK